MKLEGRQNREPYTKSKLKKIFTSWHIYLLTLLYMWVRYLIGLGRKSSPVLDVSTMVLLEVSLSSNSEWYLNTTICKLNLTPGRFLKNSKDPVYSISQINSIPTTTPAVQVVTTLAYAWISDTILNGSRWPPVIFGAVSIIPRKEI